MNQARRALHAFYVFDECPGAGVYRVSASLPDSDTYFKVEPGCITTVIARVSDSDSPETADTATGRPRGREGMGTALSPAFWFYGQSRPQRKHPM